MELIKIMSVELVVVLVQLLIGLPFCHVLPLWL